MSAGVVIESAQTKRDLPCIMPTKRQHAAPPVGACGKRLKGPSSTGEEEEEKDDGTVYITTDTRYLTDEPRLALISPSGNGLMETWTKKKMVVRVESAQNTGKTRFSNTVVTHTVESKKNGTVIVMTPLISLSHQSTRQLGDVGQGGSRDAVVVNYLDEIRRRTNRVLPVSWGVLVGCPFSMHQFVFPAIVDLLVLDEGTCLVKQLVDWKRSADGASGDSTSSSNSGSHQQQRDHAKEARQILRCLAKRSKVVMILCAQMEDNTFDLLLEILGREKKDGVVRINTSDVVLPQTDVIEVKSLWRLLQLIREAAAAGEICAVSANTAAFGQRLKREMEGTVVRPDGTPVKVVAWDSEWMTKHRQAHGDGGVDPAANIGKWLQDNSVHIFAYNTAMSPGMSLDGTYVTKRFMALFAHGADAETMAQMPDRVRNIKDRTVYAYSKMKMENVRVASPARDRERASAQVMLDYPEDSELYMDEGRGSAAKYRLVPNRMNEFRIKGHIARYLNKGNPTVSEVVAHMRATRLVGVDDAIADKPEGWAVSLKSPTANKVSFVCAKELKRMKKNMKSFEKTGRKGDDALCRKMEVYTDIAEQLPNFVVRNQDYTLKHSLAPAAFKCVADKGVHKLANFVALAQQNHCGLAVEDYNLVRTVYSASDALRSVATGERALARYIEAIMVLVGREVVDSSQINGIATACVPSTADQKMTAHTLVEKHWKFVSTLMTKAFRTKNGLTEIPRVSDAVKWSKLYKHVLLRHYGIGCRVLGDGRLQLVPVSFWGEMNIDMADYARWLCTTQGSNFGPLPPQFTACFACDGMSSDIIKCYMQGGVPLCVYAGHRVYTDPLDTPGRQRVIGYVAAPVAAIGYQEAAAPVAAIGYQEEAKDAEEEEAKVDVVDRLLEYVGFVGGRESTTKLTYDKMKEAISRSPKLTTTEIGTVWVSYKVDIKEWGTTASVEKVKRNLQMVMKRDANTSVRLKQVKLALDTPGGRVSSWTLG